MIDVSDTYDSYWLTSYLQVDQWLGQHRPDDQARFRDTMAVFGGDPAFSDFLIDDLFTPDTAAAIEDFTAALDPSTLETHELADFGRHVLHNAPFFNDLQEQMTERLSELVSEPVEPGYNFLSLYNENGICPPHRDAPDAKWTVDYCIRQSMPWQIHLSEPRSWLDVEPATEFHGRALKPGQALIFNGSSQWHYRRPIPDFMPQNYCHLVFFHFVPQGTTVLSDPRNWASHFGVKEMTELIDIPGASQERS